MFERIYDKRLQCIKTLHQLDTVKLRAKSLYIILYKSLKKLNKQTKTTILRHINLLILRSAWARITLNAFITTHRSIYLDPIGKKERVSQYHPFFIFENGF